MVKNNSITSFYLFLNYDITIYDDEPFHPDDVTTLFLVYDAHPPPPNVTNIFLVYDVVVSDDVTPWG